MIASDARNLRWKTGAYAVGSRLHWKSNDHGSFELSDKAIATAVKHSCSVAQKGTINSREAAMLMGSRA